ncbi:MAG: S46 family peptidase [Acidobacteriota bacterium]
MFRSLVPLTLTLTLMRPAYSMADEGFWLVNHFPKQDVARKYGINISDEWLQRLFRSSVRIVRGGSGAFVSSDGLIATNHHVALGCIQRLSSKDNDFFRNGFYAGSRDEEQQCPDWEIHSLQDIQDVTQEVTAAAGAGGDDAAARAARMAVISRIENECPSKDGHRCEVVSLFQGAIYHLYRYKKYTDIRLVFAPEHSLGYFGGDQENFSYPRHTLDVAFLRAYENGKPASVTEFLQIEEAGVRDGELVFIGGSPSWTTRTTTTARLRFLREKYYPFVLQLYEHKKKALYRFAGRSDENRRLVRDEIQTVENLLKRNRGQYEGLRDPAVMKRRAEEETALQARVMADSDLKRKYAQAWEGVAKAQSDLSEFVRELMFLDQGLAFDSRLFDMARTIVRLAAERKKPNEGRLKEFTEANIRTTEKLLLSGAEISKEVERVKLTAALSFFQKTLGTDNQLVRAVLGKQQPERLAQDVTSNSRLFDVAERTRLADASLETVLASDDPMIQLAVRVDKDARALRQRLEEKVQAVQTKSYALIAKAVYEIKGSAGYPDATGTFRVSYGRVSGYQDAGLILEPFTYLRGLFGKGHYTNRGLKDDPFQLPPQWSSSKAALRLDTPLNFVCTADSVAGSSGSPVVNGAGRLVGLNFDSNAFALGWSFVYSDAKGRSINVDLRGVVEALRGVYHAYGLLEELKIPVLPSERRSVSHESLK